MRLLALLLAFILAKPAFAEVNFSELYGNKIEFDVVRDGSVVGKHTTTFEEKGEELHISSRMNIEIKALFITFYSFEYATDEVWKEGQIQSISGNVLDGGDVIEFTGEQTAEGFVVKEGEDSDLIEGTVISTNHWNPGVLKLDQVLNTLTANMNAVTITNKGLETVEVEGGAIEATRYDYDGDLTDTSAWYDEKGRWIKLQFLGKDGSTISYRCLTCFKLSGNLS